jgi:hypothetical protein
MKTSDKTQTPEALLSRRLLVSKLRGEGMSTRAIAREVDISEASVRADLQRVAASAAAEVAASLPSEEAPRAVAVKAKVPTPSPSPSPLPSPAQVALVEAERDLAVLLREAQDIPRQVDALVGRPTFDEAAQAEVSALQAREAMLPTLTRAARIRVLRCQIASLEAQKPSVAQDMAQAKLDSDEADAECARLNDLLQAAVERRYWATAAASSSVLDDLDRRIYVAKQQIKELVEGSAAPAAIDPNANAAIAGAAGAMFPSPAKLELRDWYTGR